MSNVDMTSETVQVYLENGKARIVKLVCCERIVPVAKSNMAFQDGSEKNTGQVLKRSSVIVTKTLEIDMLTTKMRRDVYDHVINQGASLTSSVEKGAEDGASESTESVEVRVADRGKLSQEETRQLYTTLMFLAAAEENTEELKMLGSLQI